MKKNGIDLSGKTAVVTGGSRGLGRAMAIALARAGASVALVARNEEKLRGVKAEIEQYGGRADYFLADVTQENDVKRTESEIAAKMGKVQILINNAGISLRKDLVDFTLAEWNSVIDSSLTSTFLMCRAFVPHMKGTGYGRVLNISSIMGHISLPGRTAYSSSKTALLGLTRALALELAPHAITVNALCPGPFETDILKPLLENPDARAQLLAGVPLGRWGSPEELGELALYLCSEGAGFITGTDLLIDGGWCAR